MVHALNETIPKLRETIHQLDATLLPRCRIEAFVEIFESSPDRGPYAYVDPRAIALLRQADASPALSSSFHQLLLLELIAHYAGIVTASDLPPVIKRWYERNFARITDDIALQRHPAELYHYRDDKFLKDLGVCNLRMIPAGAQKLNRSSLPVSSLKLHGIRQYMAAAGSMVRMGSLGPIYDMHTDSHDEDLLAEFSPEGWRTFYLNVAELLKVRLDVRGLFGIGWFFDPEVTRVSPRLAYLREQVLESGGKLFEVGPSEGARKSALATSPTRRKLHEEGQYDPSDYMALWDRQALMQWAQAQPGR